MLQTVGCLVVGLDLVQVQILIPILPHRRSRPPSSSPVPRKTDLSAATTRERHHRSPGSSCRLWLKLYVLFSLVCLSLPSSAAPPQYHQRFITRQKTFESLSSLLKFIIDFMFFCVHTTT